MLARDGAVENWRDKAAMRTLLRWDDLPAIRATAAEVASAALRAATQGAGGVFDVVTTVSRLIPLKIVQRCFGFPGPDDATMLAWSRATQADMFHNLTNDPAILQADIAAGQAMQAWVAHFVDARQPWAEAAGEDTVSRLLRLTAIGALRSRPTGRDQQRLRPAGRRDRDDVAGDRERDGADPLEPGASGPCDQGRAAGR